MKDTATRTTRWRSLPALAMVTVLVVAVALHAQRASAVDGPVDVVYVATGQNFPDALAGSTLAVSTGAPLLTVNRSLPLPQATVVALVRLDPDRIVVFGGPGAVPDDVADALVPFARSGEVSRIAGSDRHETAARIADALPTQPFLPADGTAVNSERLGGQPPSAFLRAGGTAADSERLGGFTHAQTRQISIDVFGAATFNAATSTISGISFPNAGVGTLVVSLVLPPDYMPGDPLRADITLQRDVGAPQGCDVEVGAYGAVLPGTVALASFNWDMEGASPASTAGDPQVLPMPTNQQTVSMTADDTAGLMPGTAMALVFFRSAAAMADTCTQDLYVQALQIRY